MQKVTIRIKEFFHIGSSLTNWMSCSYDSNLFVHVLRNVKEVQSAIPIYFGDYFIFQSSSVR